MLPLLLPGAAPAHQVARAAPCCPAAQSRMVARVMEAQHGLTPSWEGLWGLPPDATLDMQLAPFFDWDELRICDGCGR